MFKILRSATRAHRIIARIIKRGIGIGMYRENARRSPARRCNASLSRHMTSAYRAHQLIMAGNARSARA